MSTTRINAYQQFTTTGDFSVNNFKILNLATPVNGTDAVNKAYVDSLVSGLDVKGSVRAATTADITLSGVQTIDGVSLVVGDRVLVKNQSSGQQNGIYVVQSSAWTRAEDANLSAEVTSGMYTFIEEGAAHADSGWILTTNNPIVLDTTPLAFTQFSGAGQYIAGAGLTLTGATFDVVGTAGRIVVNPDSIDLATTAVGAGSYGNSGFNVSSITVDSYGRLTAASNRDMFGTVANNLVFAGPSSGGPLAPSFRALVLGDVLPALVATPITSVQGQLLIGDGSKFVQSTLTQGTGVTITNGAGSITIANSGVTSIAGTANQITASASTGAVTLSIASTFIFPGKATFTAATTSIPSFNIPTGVAPTTPAAGDFWLINTTGLIGYYNSATHTIADLDSTQTFTNKTETNPTMLSLAAGSTETSAIFLNGSNKLVTRTLGTNAFNSTAFVASVSGTASRITSTGGATPVIDIDPTYVGQTSITTLGTVTTGTWSATTIAVNKGGTGQTTYTDGQLLIGNSSGNTLSKATLTAGTNITVTNGNGTITIAAPNAASTSKFVFREVAGTTAAPATPVVWNGVINTCKLINACVAGTECVYTNGILQQSGAGNDYTISGQDITFLTGSIPQTGDKVLINYIMA